MMAKYHMSGCTLLNDNPTLKEIVAKETVVDETGRSWPLHSGISLPMAEALYETVRARAPQTVVETGMAYGISSLAILTALREIGGDRKLISIDPWQSTKYKNLGVANVARSGLSALHELRAEPSFSILPSLLSTGLRIEMAYIDGLHTLDYVLVDAFFLDKMLRPGGVVGFNDCGRRSVHRVCSYIQRYRRYREIDVGLRPDYRSRNLLVSAARRLLHWSHADRYFEKREDWELRVD